MASRGKIQKALVAMKKMGYPNTVVRPILNRLLKLYDNEWFFIEENGYQVLVEALTDRDEKLQAQSIELKRMKDWSEDDAEEREPPLKRSKRNFRKLEMVEPTHEEENVSKHCHGKGKTSSSDDERNEFDYPIPLAQLENSGDESDPVHKFSEKRIITYQRSKHKVFSKVRSYVHDADPASEDNLQENEPMSYDLVEFGVPIAVIPPVSPQLLYEESSHENRSSVKGNCSIFPEMIDLDADDTCTEQPILLERTSACEENHSEYMDYERCEEEKNENNAQDSMKLDVAISSRGEMEIPPPMIKSSPKSDSHVLNLEEVLRQNGFSARLMKDMCESFLAKGTTSTHSNNHQITLSCNSIFTNCPIRLQNLFEVPMEIPRPIRSFHLQLDRCKIYLKGSTEMDRNVLEIDDGAYSSGTMTVQNQPYYQYIEDITKGHEDNKISLINESGDDRLPEFGYISKNVTYQNAFTGFLLSRISKQDCCHSEDCLSSEIPCACANISGGECAYAPCGLVKETFVDNCLLLKHCGQQQKSLFYCQDCPLERSIDESLAGKCKGHLTRNFIKECWYACGCSMNCGNRVVQRGITVKLQVFMTPEGKGWGLRTLEEIPSGGFVCEYVGEYVTIKELSKRNMQSSTSGDNHACYPVILDANWSAEGVLEDEKALCIDSSAYGNVARFINHRCFDANLVDIPVQVESPDRQFYHLAFFTTRKISAMEELTWDYGIDFTDRDSVKPFQCQCGSKFCGDRQLTKRSRSGM